MVLEHAIEAFIAARVTARRLRPTTERTYRHHLVKLADHVGPDTDLAAITARDLERWILTMSHLESSSLRTAVAPVRAMFAWAVDRELRPDDPTSDIPRPKLARAQYRALEASTTARLLHVSNFRERTIVMIGLHLGLRCCEMSRANVSDWDRDRETLFVRGKGGADRILPVMGEIEWVLSLWADGRRTGPLFPSQHADRLGPNSISQMVTRVARRAGVAATAHQLRHTCAHDMLAMGARPNAVQRFLGHADLSTTAVYLAARDEELRSAMCRNYAVGEAIRHHFKAA